MRGREEMVRAGYEGPPLAGLIPVLDALEDIAVLRETPGRHMLVQLIESELHGRLHVPDHQIARLHLISILYACRQHLGGLRALEYALPIVAGGNSLAVREALLRLGEVTVLDVVPDADRNSLRNLISDLETPAALRTHLASEGYEQHVAAARLDSAWAAYECLEQANAGADGLPPCLAFVERLAALVEPATCDRLRAWTDRQALSVGLLAELEALRGALTPPRPDRSATFYLLIQIERYGPKPDRYLLSHWRQRDPRGWFPERGDDIEVTGAGMERAVEGLVTLVEEDLRLFDGPMVVEFVLPHALLNLPVDHWVKESTSERPVPLGISYPMVVRSLDRMRRRDWHRVWRQRWRQLRGIENMGAGTFWSRPDGDDYLSRLEAKFLADPSLVSLVLSSPPLVRSSRPDEVDEVVLALRSGLPVVIWDRENCRQPAFQEVVSRLLNGDPADAAGLPERVRRLRVQGAEGRRRRPVTVLLDDPDRLLELDEPPGIPG